MAAPAVLPKYLILGLLLCCGVLTVHGEPYLLGWGRSMPSNTGVMDPTVATHLGSLQTAVKQMSIHEGTIHPYALYYLDAQGRIWDPFFEMFDYDKNELELLEPMAFQPSSLNAYFPSPVKSLTPGHQFMALTEGGELYTWGTNIYAYPIQNPTLISSLTPASTNYPLVPYFNPIWAQLNSHANGIFSAISTDGVGMVFSKDNCDVGTGLGPQTNALPVGITNGSIVTHLSVRSGHGAAATLDAVVGLASVWSWGQLKYVGRNYTDNLETCDNAPIKLWTFNTISTRITHLVTTQNGTFFVANNETVYYFDRLPPRKDTAFTNIASNGVKIVKVVAAAHSVHFLYSNGEIWSRTAGRYAAYGTTTLLTQHYDMLSDDETVYKAELVLPTSFKIVDIEAKGTTSGIYAIAGHIVYNTYVSQKIPPLQNPHPTTLVYWGFCPFWSAGNIDYENKELDSAPMVFPTEIELRLLEPFNVASFEIKRWSSDGYHSLILTTGHVLMWGTSHGSPDDFGSYGPYAKRSYAKTPKILDDYFYGGNIANVVDVASSNGTHMILLNNGSVVLWGKLARYWNYDPFYNTRRRDNNPSLAAFDVIPGPFTSLTAKLGGMGAITTFGSITTWGPLLSAVGDITPYTHTSCSLGTTAKFSVSGDTIIAVQQTGIGSTVMFMSSTASPDSLYDCQGSICMDFSYQLFQWCQLVEPVGFNPADIQEIFAFSGWNAAVTSDGVWILGRPPFMPANFTRTWEKLPMPTGLSDWSSVKNVSFNSENMYWLLTNGTLISTAADGISLRVPPFAMADFQASTSQILSDFHVEEISTLVGDCQFAKVRRDSRPPSYAPYLTRHFGSTEYGQNGAGSIVFQSAMESGKLLPSGHPLESDTITQYTVGSIGAIKDGNLSNSDKPRFMFWGGAGSDAPDRRFPLYNLPGLLQDLGGSFLDDIVTITSSSSMGQPVLVTALKNCTIYTHRSSDNVATVYSDQDPDPSYPYNFRRRYPIDVIADFAPFSMPACEQFHTDSGTSIIDIKCMDVYPRIQGTCFVLASSRQHIFLSFRYILNAPSYECQSGFYGYEPNCLSNAHNNPLSQAVITTVTLGPSVNISRFAIGQLHGLVLTTDGRLASWGSNHVGQLGIPTSGNSSTLQFIPIPVAYSGSVTKIATSKWNSYAVIDDHLVLSWGSNKLGGLGNSSYVSHSSSPIPVQAPTRPIRDLTCAAASCYLLYQNGETYTWGMTGGEVGNILGRRTRWASLARFSPEPRPATLFTFPPPSRRVAQILASPNAYSIFVRGELYSGPIGPTDECPLPSPGYQYFCVDGVWTIIGNIAIGEPDSNPLYLSLQGHTSIVGNLTFTPPWYVTFNDLGFDPTKPLLNVTGCMQGSISLNVRLVEKFDSIIEAGLDGRKVAIVESACPSDVGRIDSNGIPRGECRRIRNAVVYEQGSNGRYTVNAIFSVDNSKCSKWWVILLSVVGAVLILTGILGAIWYYRRKKKFEEIPS